MFHPMMQEQIELEQEVREATRRRYFSLHDKAEERGDVANTHVGRNVFDFLYKPFLDEINRWEAGILAGKPGRRGSAARLTIEFADNKVLAFIFLKHLINTTLTLSNRERRSAAKLTRVALTCAQAVHDELRIRYFAENRKKLLKRIVTDFNQKDLPRRRRRDLIIKQFHAQQLEWTAPGWEQASRLKLGVTLIDLFIAATGAVENVVVYEGIKKINCIAFTPELRAELDARMSEAADMFTVFFPLVVPPKPWTNDALVGGAYYTDNIQPYLFIKGAKMKFLAELENRDMSKILEPINALQNTGWRVNPVMADVLTHVYEQNIDITGLPPADPKPILPPAGDIDNNEELAKEYRKDCYIIHDFNRRTVSKRIAVLRTLSLANRFARYDAFYFPHDVDTRGRAYPKVPFLNPQGPDYVKSLLEFSEGKPITTPEHEGYLAIAVANAWGMDKLTLTERVQWVEDNEAMLQEVALDPKTDLRWTEAPEPFMALRGALEWRGLCEQGSGYVSHMPVHFDATCSGLQHFSALLLDAEGGYHVNLTPNPERQDIYSVVAKRATASLALDTNEFAPVALSMGIDRAMCKRPVMIVPYSGTFSACMTYTNDHYRERLEGGEALPMELRDIHKNISPLVAKHIWDAISDTVIAAREAMTWVTHTAGLASKGLKEPIQWSTPDGFVVQQAKYEDKITKIDTYLDGGRRIRSLVANDSAKLDVRKMRNSLSPNYIHSLDACHLRGSINKALEIGGMSFSAVHDSFATHCADMPVFVSECIRPAFVEMYWGTNLLEQFRLELELNISPDNLDKVKELPTPGGLDIEGVLDSAYFFS